MSSPDLESPYNTYSLRGDVTLGPSQPEPSPSPRSASPDTRHPPRLRFRSPELFQHILNDAGPAPQTFQPPTINYEETMNDVNRALLSANRAIQNAQEAFQSRRLRSGNTEQSAQEVVDLTENSPPSFNSNMAASSSQTTHEDAAYDAFLSRIIHPHDSGTRHTVGHSLLSEPSYGAYPPPPPDEDPTSRYSGPDSLVGPRRRYQNQGSMQLEMQRMFARSQQRRSDSRDEQAAIRRQQRARAQWEENQRRTNDRIRLEEQRQRLLNSPNTSRTSQSMAMSPPPALSHRPASSSSSANSSSSVEAVDLTQVDDSPSLAAALSKQRQDAITLQKDSSAKATGSGTGDGAGRTALTDYKCPICIEVPQNATTTSCGHLFCHKCIIDTLKWSEQARRDELPASRKVKGVCPVCRKELARKEEPGPGRTLIPLELKLISKKELKRKREEAEEQEESKARTNKKGKEKVYDIGDLVDDEATFQPHLGEGSSSSQKENNNNIRSRASGEATLGNDLDDLFAFDLETDF